jgi:hypothetical protein
MSTVVPAASQENGYSVPAAPGGPPPAEAPLYRDSNMDPYKVGKVYSIRDKTSGNLYTGAFVAMDGVTKRPVFADLKSTSGGPVPPTYRSDGYHALSPLAYTVENEVGGRRRRTKKHKRRNRKSRRR